MDKIVHSRLNDGNVPVHISDDHYTIHYPDKKIITCTSARQLLITLTGHPDGRHWTFDRYFKQGVYEKKSIIEPIVPVMDFFKPKVKRPTGVIQRSWTKKDADAFYLKHGYAKVGIDLEERGDEVAKILFSKFKNWIFGSGYNPQDILQEVYKAILVRNAGTCPFDVRKASFGHYVHQVCSGVLSNYYHKRKKRAAKEVIGMKTYQDGVWKNVDVADALVNKADDDPRCRTTITDDLLNVLSKRDTKINRVAIQMVPLLGYTQNDMSEMLGVSKASISKGMMLIRKTALKCGYQPLA